MPEEHTGQLGFEYAWKELLTRSKQAGRILTIIHGELDITDITAWRAIQDLQHIYLWCRYVQSCLALCGFCDSLRFYHIWRWLCDWTGNYRLSAVCNSCKAFCNAWCFRLCCSIAVTSNIAIVRKSAIASTELPHGWGWRPDDNGLYTFGEVWDELQRPACCCCTFQHRERERKCLTRGMDTSMLLDDWSSFLVNIVSRFSRCSKISSFIPCSQHECFKWKTSLEA